MAAILSLQEEKAQLLNLWQWPNDSIIKRYLYMWKTSLTEIIKNEFGESRNICKDSADNYYEKPSRIKKNSLAIERA